MKLGFGFYRHMLNRSHYDFAVQCGATRAVVHLVDYTHQGQAQAKNSQPVGGVQGWGLAGGTPESMWTKETLLQLKQDMQEAGLQLEAIENFDPAHWYDVLLGGAQRQRQLAHLQQIIRNVGGKVPHYTETFFDDGDIDMRRIVGIWRENRYEGVIVPDHTPQMSCGAPWHAGMAYAMGCMKALFDE